MKRLVCVVVVWLLVNDAISARFKRSKPDTFKVLLNLYKMNPLKHSYVYQYYLNNTLNPSKRLNYNLSHESSENATNTNNEHETLEKLKDIEETIHKSQPKQKTMSTPKYKVSYKPERFDGTETKINFINFLPQIQEDMTEFKKLIESPPNNQNSVELKQILSDDGQQSDIARDEQEVYKKNDDSDGKRLPEDKKIFPDHQVPEMNENNNDRIHEDAVESWHNVIGQYSATEKETSQTPELQGTPKIQVTQRYTKSSQFQPTNIKVELSDNLSEPSRNLFADKDTEIMENIAASPKTETLRITANAFKTDVSNLLQSQKAKSDDIVHTTDDIFEASKFKIDIGSSLNNKDNEESYINENNLIDENREEFDVVAL